MTKTLNVIAIIWWSKNFSLEFKYNDGFHWPIFFLQIQSQNFGNWEISLLRPWYEIKELCIRQLLRTGRLMKKNIHHAQKSKNCIKNYIYLKGRTLSAKGITAPCTLPLVIGNVLQTPVVALKNMLHIPMLLFCPDNYFP